MIPMDETDQKQQQEIVDLQKKDIQHDEKISLFMHLYIALFVIILALFVGAVIMMPALLINDHYKYQVQK